MNDASSGRMAMTVAALAAALALSMGTPIPSGSLEPFRASLTCFTISGDIACIETVDMPPVMPIFPAAIVPVGPGVEGESNDVVIRDDGGHEVARG